MSNALTTRSGAAFAMVPQSVQEALEFARLMANSGMVPDIYAGQAGRVLAAMQLGAEVGLPPMTALQRIFIQNGKPTMDTRGCLAIVEASGYLIAKSETWDAVTKTATVMVQRKGRDPIVRTFSEEDAKRVHCKENQQSITLDQKGTYRAYPQRMYTRRALGYALMDEFADILCGLTPWDVQIETVPDSGENPRHVLDGEVVRQPTAAAPSGGVVDAELAAKLEEGFSLCHLSEGQKRIKLAAYKGREAELVEWLRKEWAARNGVRLKGADAGAKAGAEAGAAGDPVAMAGAAAAGNATAIMTESVKAAETIERELDDYTLPDGRIVKVDATAAKGAAVIDFTLEGGEIVQATRRAAVTVEIDGQKLAEAAAGTIRDLVVEPVVERMPGGELVNKQTGEILAVPASKMRALADPKRKAEKGGKA